MFRIRPVVQHGQNFNGMLFLEKEDIGGVGRDDQGIYLNLRRKLSLNETIEMLKMVNEVSNGFSDLEVEIQYSE